MELAFGSNQQRISVSENENVYSIKVDGPYKLLKIRTQTLGVNDQALNTELPEGIRTFNPNAIISIGAGRDYKVEVRATDRGLKIGADGFVHDSNSSQTLEQENYSLWNAIQEGIK